MAASGRSGDRAPEGEPGEAQEGRRRAETLNAMASRALSPGFRVGHWTSPGGETGCTVILPPPGNVSSYDIRGSSPGSRELASLDLERQRTEIHGLLFTGGSAFGLAAADGVVRWLEEHSIGFRTPIATIPIVPAAVIFDVAAGMAEVRPGPDSGHAACEAAAEGDVATGRVGAGAGATVGKWAGHEFLVPGGIGIAWAADGDLEVRALAVANPFGDIIGADGSVLAGTTKPSPAYRPPPVEPEIGWNTVLVAVTTIASLSKSDVRFLAARASDGVTRAIRPAHTRYDGDVSFAIAAPAGPGRVATSVDLDRLAVLASDATAAAIRDAVAG
jgi:L-aminopeptidase/D-esterase-like protein